MHGCLQAIAILINTIDDLVERGQSAYAPCLVVPSMSPSRWSERLRACGAAELTPGYLLCWWQLKDGALSRAVDPDNVHGFKSCQIYLQCTCATVQATQLWVLITNDDQ